MGRKSCNLGHVFYIPAVQLFETQCGHLLINKSTSLTKSWTGYESYFLLLLQNGFVSGLPELCKFAFSLVFSTTADYMLRKEYLSITAVRKLSVATS